MILHPHWRSEDKANAKAFFESPTGQLLISTLMMNRPRIEGKSLDERALSGTAAQNWEDCANLIAIIVNTDLNEQGTDNLRQMDTSRYGNEVEQR